MTFARNLREIWVPGPRIFAKKFGEPRCETLAYPKLRLVVVGGRRAPLPQITPFVTVGGFL